MKGNKKLQRKFASKGKTPIKSGNPYVLVFANGQPTIKFSDLFTLSESRNF